MTQPQNTTAISSILRDMARVKHEITAQLKPHAEVVPDRDDRDYAAQQLAYIHNVNALRLKMRPRLFKLAEKISALHGADWRGQDHVVQMWLEYAHLVQALRHNPAKGPAAIYISPDNKLIAYSAANYWLMQMHPKETLAMRYLNMDSRGESNICAERAALADVIGHNKLATAGVLRHKKSADKRFKTKKIPKRMRAFSERIIALAKTITDFQGSTLVTTAEPCGLCAPAVIAAGVKHIISDAQSHAHPLSEKRHAAIIGAREATRSEGITTMLVTRMYQPDGKSL